MVSLSFLLFGYDSVAPRLGVEVMVKYFVYCFSCSGTRFTPQFVPQRNQPKVKGLSSCYFVNVEEIMDVDPSLRR